jgi:Asp-tRNA(Asn)/Glu-tRNA(Gln) amidotransferase C subunit
METLSLVSSTHILNVMETLNAVDVDDVAPIDEKVKAPEVKRV